MARQIAASALFGRGGDSVLAVLRDKGCGDAITALKGIVRNGLNVPRERMASLSEIELVRLVQLTHRERALEAVFTAAVLELKERQDNAGLWGSVGRTAHIITSMLEIEDAQQALAGVPEWDEAVARSVEALRGSYSPELNSWGGIIQDTAMSVHALGLYRSRYDVESQELFETVETDARLSQRSPSVGRARIDLGALFGRELDRESKSHALERELEIARQRVQVHSQALRRARRQATVFQIFGGASVLLLTTLVASFLLSPERAAFISVVSGTGSLLGLVVGAMIAIPVTYLLTPRSTTDSAKKDEEQ
jgi:hypothetical protein